MLAGYTPRQCAEDLRQLLAVSNNDLAAVQDEATPFIKQLLARDDLVDLGVMRQGNHTSDSLWIYYDYELLINIARLPSERLPVHNHGTWELISVYKGAVKYTGYERLDDGSKPYYSELKVAEDRILYPGDVAICPTPPNDIHSFVALTPDTIILAAGEQFAPIRQYHTPQDSYYVERHERAWLENKEHKA